MKVENLKVGTTYRNGNGLERTYVGPYSEDLFVFKDELEGYLIRLRASVIKDYSEVREPRQLWALYSAKGFMWAIVSNPEDVRATIESHGELYGPFTVVEFKEVI